MENSDNSAYKKKIFEGMSKESLNILLSLCLEAKKHSDLIKAVGAVTKLPPLDKVAYAKEQLIITEKTALCTRLHYINIYMENVGREKPFPEAEHTDVEKMIEQDYASAVETLETLIAGLKAAGASLPPEREHGQETGSEKKLSENPDTDIMIKVMLLSLSDTEKN